MTDEMKKYFAELLGYEVLDGKTGEYEDEHFVVNNTTWFFDSEADDLNFSPESDEFFWKILEGLDDSQSNSLDNFIHELPVYGPSALDNYSKVALWYHNNRETVLEAVYETREK